MSTIARIRLSLLVLSAVVGLPAGVESVSRSDTAEAPAGSYTVMAPQPTTVSSNVVGGEMSFDMGKVDAYTQGDATHIFSVKNTSAFELNLTGLRGTCGCENLAFIAGGKDLTKVVLPPGESADVRMSVRLMGQPAGPLTKVAWIIGDHNQILGVLTLSIVVRERYSISPSEIDIGQMAADGNATASIAIEVDKDALVGGKMPQLTSDSPWIQPVATGQLSVDQRDGKASVIEKYAVNGSHQHFLWSDSPRCGRIARDDRDRTIGRGLEVTFRYYEQPLVANYN